MQHLGKCLCAGGVVVGSGVVLAHWLAGTEPKKDSEGRVALLREWISKWFPLTHTFEQFIKDFEFEEIRPDGTIVGSINASGVLLSKDGRLHEGGLMLLIDSLSSITVMAAGRLTGVSMDMGVAVLVPVKAGTRLRIESRALRIGRTTAFLAVDVRRADGAGELLAIGQHTKHVGMPLLVRVWHGLAVRIPALARRWTLQSLVKLAAVQKQHSIKKCAGKSMEEALGIGLREDDAGSAERFTAPVAIQLINGYWSGHGAASAGLCAEAVHRHLAHRGLSGSSLAELQLSYLEPVPAFRPAKIDVTALPGTAEAAAAAEALRHFLVEIRSERGKLLVRGRASALVLAAAA